MTDLLRSLVERMIRDPGTTLLSVVLATLVWLFVQNQQTDEGSLRIPVAFVFDDHLVNLDPLLRKATLQVEGPRAEIRRAANLKLRILADLEDAGPGEHEVSLDAFIPELPAGLTVRGLSPRTYTIRLDERSRRNVRVEPAWVGEPRAGFSIVNVASQPDVVEVTGPRSVVAQLEHVSSKPIDLSGVATDEERPFQLDLPRNVKPVDPWLGHAAVSVESLRTTITVAEVPVFMGSHYGWRPAEGFETVKVELEGPTNVLRNIAVGQIAAVVELPDVPEADLYRVVYDATSGPSMRILHPHPDLVSVAASPPPIDVVRE